MYKVDSPQAEEFIHHEEILETLEYAWSHKDNRAFIEQLIEKAALCKGLTHREAATLLECDQPDLIERIFHLAKEIKQKFYGNRIVMFAPLYLSNYCVNGCVYCPYHAKNKTIARKKLTQEEIRKEVIALQDMGHKRLALEAGEHPTLNSLEYILESIRTIYSIRHKNGAIRRVNVNIAATTVENYRRLKDAGIGTYILFQETYHKKNYEALHPTGPKSNYAYHTEAMDRAMEGGIDDVGMGVLFGLNTYRYDFVGLLMHAEHLEARFGVGPHTISVPRICSADDIDAGDFPNAISDDIFSKIVAVIRIAVPYTGMIISTRESQESREKVLELGISQISGGSRTSVGGYAETELPEDNSAQFAARIRIYPQLLHRLLSGRTHRGPIYVLSQIGTDSQLLRPQCINDSERIPRRLCVGRHPNQRNETDSQRDRPDSESQNQRNSHPELKRYFGRKKRFQILRGKVPLPSFHADN